MSEKRISVKQLHEASKPPSRAPSESAEIADVDPAQVFPNQTSSRTSNHHASLINNEPDDGRIRLPPINKSDTPRTEIHRREQNVAGPPVNRASALRYYATRQRMDQLVGDSIYSYDPRRSKMRKSRQSQSLPRSLNNSTHSINQGSLRSSRLSSQSRLSNSNYSVIHPLSENYDEIYYTGKTKWSNEPIKSKVGSLDNYYHRPGGGDKDIREIRYHFQAPNSISSQTKIYYGPRRDGAGVSREYDHDAGEYTRLPNRIKKPTNVKSRIGSLDNVHHRPSGGTRAIFTDRLPWTEGFKHRKG